MGCKNREITNERECYPRILVGLPNFNIFLEKKRGGVNDKFTVVGMNIAEKATMIWNVADMLRGLFKPHESDLIILPIIQMSTDTL